MSDIDALPTMLIGAIRRGAWISPEAFRMRETARTIQQAANAGMDVDDLTMMLARVAADEIANVTIHTPETERIGNLVNETIRSDRSTDMISEAALRQRYGPCATARDLHEVAKRYVADNYAKIDAPARIA